MLYNLDAYSQVFSMPKLNEKEHPENIYIEPISKWDIHANILFFLDIRSTTITKFSWKRAKYYFKFFCWNKAYIRIM